MHRKAGGGNNGVGAGAAGRPRGGRGGGGGHYSGGGPGQLDSRDGSNSGGGHHYYHGRGGKGKWAQANNHGNNYNNAHATQFHVTAQAPQQQIVASHQQNVASKELPAHAPRAVEASQDPHARTLFVLTIMIVSSYTGVPLASLHNVTDKIWKKGNTLEIEVGKNTVYRGIYSMSPPGRELSVLLQCVTKLDGNGAPGPVLPAMVFKAKDIRSFTCCNPDMSAILAPLPGNKEDTAISGRSGPIRERTLQKWAPDDSSAPALGLEESSSGIGAWDQFATNERKFGVTTDFDEHMYTTTVDKSDPNYKQREAQAIRLAREIERGPANNAHVAEERNLDMTGAENMDEEDRYSSVIRQPGKYVPPGARRPSVQLPAAKIEPAKETKRPESSAASAKDHKKPSTAAKDPSVAKQGPTPKPETPSAEPAHAAVVHKPLAPQADQRLTNNKRAAAIQKLSQKTEAAKSKNILPEPKSVDASHVASVFKEFSTGEKEKLGKKRHDLQRQEKMSMVEDFKTFSSTFKLKTPMPQDLHDILYKEKASYSVSGEKADAEVSKHAGTSAATGGKAAALAPAAATQNKAKVQAETAPLKEAAKDVSVNAQPKKGDEAVTSPTPSTGKPKSTFKFNAAAAEFTPSFAPANTSVQRSPPQSERSPYLNQGKRMNGKNYPGKPQYGKGPLMKYKGQYAQNNLHGGQGYAGEEMYHPQVDQPYFPYANMAPYGYRPMPGRPFVPMPGMSVPPGAGYMMPGQFGPAFVPGQMYPPHFAPPPPNGNMRMFPKGQPFNPEDPGAYQGQPGVSSPMQPGFMRSPPQMYQPGMQPGPHETKSISTSPDLKTAFSVGPMLGYPPEMMGHFPQPMMMPMHPGWAVEPQMPPMDNSPPVVTNVEDLQPTRAAEE
ncbi:hypothetical protein HDU86_001311 [Geranomyces michiganensis]|nr:hypothetical protein HDU86_001311 [Geranomyces michiganensis]